MGKKKQGQEKSAGSQEASTSGPTGGGGEASGGPAWLGGGAEDPPQCFHPHAQAVNQQGLAQGPLCSAGPAAKGCNLCPQALGGAACLSGQAPNSGGTRREASERLGEEVAELGPQSPAVQTLCKLGDGSHALSPEVLPRRQEKLHTWARLRPTQASGKPRGELMETLRASPEVNRGNLLGGGGGPRRGTPGPRPT
uniref:Uncharacterized protein n=1 Tax=Mustela putorius furo TaxID=9669 RepID=M3YSQ2_MUSPF